MEKQDLYNPLTIFKFLHPGANSSFISHPHICATSNLNFDSSASQMSIHRSSMYSFFFPKTCLTNDTQRPKYQTSNFPLQPWLLFSNPKSTVKKLQLYRARFSQLFWALFISFFFVFQKDCSLYNYKTSGGRCPQTPYKMLKLRCQNYEKFPWGLRTSDPPIFFHKILWMRILTPLFVS